MEPVNSVAMPNDQHADRQDYTQGIIDSTASKKVIVAGPGTGKTTAFEAILKQSGSQNNLVLTFINRLVNDLNCRLSDYATVRTLHKFCMGIFHRQYPDWYMVSVLSDIISEDTGVKKEIFDELFHRLDETNPLFRLYLKRAAYYKAISFNDSVYRVLKKATLTPSIILDYDNILIDEFQDFSALEVAFIKQLESHGQILIVGDDDQAIYIRKFDLGKSLRDLYSSGAYHQFNLPYCSRCPKVIVDSVNDIVTEATSKGHLNGRVTKQFIAYEPGKELVNSNYPKLQVVNLASAQATALFINKFVSSVLETELEEYKQRQSNEPLILIIGTKKYLTMFKNQFADLAEYMESDQLTAEKNAGICEAYEILLNDENANMGWRLLLYHDPISPPRVQKKIIKDSMSNIPLVDLVPDDYKQKHKMIVDLIRTLIMSAGSVKQTEQSLEHIVGSSQKDNIVKYFTTEQGQDQIASCESPSPIQIVTYQGSKGLAADYVFLLGVNNGDIPKDPTKIADYEICEFIVGLTRVKKECYVLPISNVYGEIKNRSVFLSWITPKRVANSISLSKNDVIKFFRQCKTEKQ
ncbi:MAG: AAA family ATPase [Candidatus Cloacimonetes bacterium]|nr:AAA family ATPase [Candidatus Cloacimonadota bacterium]